MGSIFYGSSAWVVMERLLLLLWKFNTLHVPGLIRCQALTAASYRWVRHLSRQCLTFSITSLLQDKDKPRVWPEVVGQMLPPLPGDVPASAPSILQCSTSALSSPPDILFLSVPLPGRVRSGGKWAHRDWHPPICCLRRCFSWPHRWTSPGLESRL